MAPRQFLFFQERVTKPRGIPAASDDNTAYIVSRGFRSALLLVVASAIFGWLLGFTLTAALGPATSGRIVVLQVVGASILLLATIYLRGIETWGRATLIERVDRWIYCTGYFVGTAAIVASLTWS